MRLKLVKDEVNGGSYLVRSVQISLTLEQALLIQRMLAHSQPHYYSDSVFAKASQAYTDALNKAKEA